MAWYQFIAVFFAGAFLSNSIPHLIYGISGDKFPTPFSKPPGKGLSPAYINVLWASFNVLIGYILLIAGKLQFNDYAGMAVFFVGAVLMGLSLASNFSKKDKE